MPPPKRPAMFRPKCAIAGQRASILDGFERHAVRRRHRGSACRETEYLIDTSKRVIFGALARSCRARDATPPRARDASLSGPLIVEYASDTAASHDRLWIVQRRNSLGRSPTDHQDSLNARF
jgi:hypothetical protein